MNTLRDAPTSSFNNSLLGSTPQSSPSRHPRHPLNILPVLPSSPPSGQINAHSFNSTTDLLNRASNSIPIPSETALSAQTGPIQTRQHQSTSPTPPYRGRKRKQISPTGLNDHPVHPSSTSDARKCLEVLDYMKRKKLSVPNFLAEYIRLDLSIDGDDNGIKQVKESKGLSQMER